MSGQIRDTKPKTGQMGVPEEPHVIFSGHVVKIATVPENAGRMVTLLTSVHVEND